MRQHENLLCQRLSRTARAMIQLSVLLCIALSVHGHIGSCYEYQHDHGGNARAGEILRAWLPRSLDTETNVPLSAVWPNILETDEIEFQAHGGDRINPCRSKDEEIFHDEAKCRGNGQGLPVDVDTDCHSSSPHGGYCDIKPKKGLALLQQFEISCHQWQHGMNRSMQTVYDANENEAGLTYELRIPDQASNRRGRLVYAGANPSFRTIRLPAGASQSNFVLELLVKIADDEGAHTNYLIKAQVYDDLSYQQESSALEDILSHFGTAIVTPENSTNATKLLSTVYHISEAVNKVPTVIVDESIEAIQQIRARLMENAYHAFMGTDRKLRDVLQAAQALQSVTSLTVAGELLRQTEITGADFVSELIQALGFIEDRDGDTMALLTALQDVFRSSSNIIEARWNKYMKEGNGFGCYSKDSRMMSVLFGAIDSCLDMSISVLLKADERVTNVQYTSRLIEATVEKYQSDADNGRYMMSAAGGFHIPSNGDGQYAKISKFIGSMVNPYQCDSPKQLRSSPVVALEVFDEKGRPAKTSAEYTIFVARDKRLPRQRKEMEVWPGERFEVSVSITDPFQILEMTISSEVSGSQYNIWQRASNGQDKDNFDNFANISSGSTKSLFIEATTDVMTMQSQSLVIDIVGKDNVVAPHHVILSASYYSCIYWSETNKKWQSDGCWPDLLASTDEYMVCRCNHLTSFTAADFVVPVNKINFSRVFQIDIGDNSLVLATILSLFVLYLILAVYLRRKDKQDMKKWIAAPQAFNSIDEKYYYRITVFTGLGTGAGTTGVVALILYGDGGKSRIIRLVDKDKRLTLDSGTVRSFLVAVRDPLGPLRSMKVELYRSARKGYDKWFLERMEVVDMLTNKRYDFVCYKWFGADKEGHEITRELLLSDDSQKTGFAHLLSSHIRVQVFDEYLWGSVVSRQMPSNFTRVQRLSCCAAVLCLAMISNAMFYGKKDEAKDTKGIEIETFRLSFGTVYIALISSLVTLPASITMVSLFKKARPNVRVVPTTTDLETEAKVRRKYTVLSRCYIILAWLVVFLSSFASCFFVVLYSLEWGARTSKEWLYTQMTSFFLSAAIVDPSKAILFAIIFSLLFKVRRKPFEFESDDIYRRGQSPGGKSEQYNPVEVAY
ncbi:polycystin-1-related protein-like isoform X2 [Ptychodera flava]|uniref:polycystin-1-related protein-like isoform X2 n=1 Tax=Ptychodera flava TaxID=63121 RepID=UPI00396A7943